MTTPTATIAGAWDIPVLDVPFTAGGAIPQYSLVKKGTNEGEVVVTTAITDDVFGIAQVTAASGDVITIRMLGISRVIAAATLAAGDQIMPKASGTDGQADKAGGATAKSCGLVIHGAASGEQASVMILPAGNRPPNA